MFSSIKKAIFKSIIPSCISIALFILWELIKSRGTGWANPKIDEEAGAIMEYLAPIINEIFIAPLGYTVAAAIAVVLIIFVHAYIKENTQPELADYQKTSLAINLNTDHVDYGDYEQILAVNVLNKSEHDLKEECQVKLEKMDRASPDGIDLPVVLRTAGQARGNRSGHFSLSRFEDKGVPILFRNPRRKNEWYLFDEQGNKHLIYAYNTKMLIGVYGGENNKKYTISFNRSPIRGNFEYSPVLTEFKNSDFIVQKSNRMPLLELCNKAREVNWNLSGEKDNHTGDFAHGLRQAGLDGDIQFWGRKNKSLGMLNKDQPLQNIDKQHWENHEIKLWAIANANNNFELETSEDTGINLTRHVPTFVDLHVDERKAMEWLIQDANKYQGIWEK